MQRSRNGRRARSARPATYDANGSRQAQRARQRALCVAAAPQASIGVLVRTNAAVARLIYLLRSLGVEASEEGGNPLVDSPAVELLLSLLRLAQTLTS